MLAGPLEDVTPLDVVARMTVPWLCDWCNILLVDDDGQARSAAAYHHDASKIELHPPAAPRPRAATIAASRRVIATGEPDARQRHQRRAARAARWRTCRVSVALARAASKSCARSACARDMLVPLRARGQIIGAMVFASAERRSAATTTTT